MIGLLADATIQGQVELLALRMQAEPWREFWDYLHLRCVTFAEAGLDPTDSDAVIWQRCQDLGILLITDNRNDDGPDSLENTIRMHATVTSLPGVHHWRCAERRAQCGIRQSRDRPPSSVSAGAGYHSRYGSVVSAVSGGTATA